MKIIDLNNWNRREHYEFFSKMTSPYFGITAEVDCTNAYRVAKKKGCSFFAHYLYKSLMAINAVEELRMRIIDNQVVLLDDNMGAGITVSRDDGTYGLAYIDFYDTFEQFNQVLQNEIVAVRNSTGLRLNKDAVRKDLIHYSTIPWASFTSILHPRNYGTVESIPKIVFGKFREQDGKKLMPVSLEAHHGLADGYHLSKFFVNFQQQLDCE